MGPIAFNVFRGTQTDLDLNGPNLSFLQNVSDVIVDSTGGGNAHLLELQATFPQSERATNTGTITYQWFEQKVGGDVRLQDGANITGTATTTLTLSNIFSSKQWKRLLPRSEFTHLVQQLVMQSTNHSNLQVGELIIIPHFRLLRTQNPLLLLNKRQQGSFALLLK